MNAQVVPAELPKEALSIARNISDYELELVSIEIDSRERFFAGSELLKSVKRTEKALEEKRVEVTKPLRLVIDTLNGWFKPQADRLAAVERDLKRKMAVFESKERQRAAAEQARLDAIARREREELEARAEKAADKGNMEQALALSARAADTAPKQADVAPVKAAGTGFSDKWGFEVINAAMVPREYLKVDEVKLGAYVRAMKGDAIVPGVRVFKDFKVSVRV